MRGGILAIGGNAAFEGGNWQAEIKLHISDAIAGEGAFERFVDLLIPIFYRFAQLSGGL
jgi:hypothetical protein